jgi:hypothetical protein
MSTTDHVRCKFLEKIGIDVRPGLAPPAEQVSSTGASKSFAVTERVENQRSLDWIHPRNRNVQCYREPLKFDFKEDRTNITKRQHDEQLRHRHTMKRIHTQHEVSTSYSSTSSHITACTVSTGVSSISKPTKHTTFVDSVDVLPIPMRNEYSSRIKARLWADSKEIHENAARNAIEFATEGCVLSLSSKCFYLLMNTSYICRLFCALIHNSKYHSWDWRNVIEDDAMYMSVSTGELIHPCHYDPEYRSTPMSS